jgi:hypothetical protein
VRQLHWIPDAPAPYDFKGKNLTAYGGQLPTRVMSLYQFVLALETQLLQHGLPRCFYWPPS